MPYAPDRAARHRLQDRRRPGAGRLPELPARSQPGGERDAWHRRRLPRLCRPCPRRRCERSAARRAARAPDGLGASLPHADRASAARPGVGSRASRRSLDDLQSPGRARHRGGRGPSDRGQHRSGRRAHPLPIPVERGAAGLHTMAGLRQERQRHLRLGSKPRRGLRRLRRLPPREAGWTVQAQPRLHQDQLCELCRAEAVGADHLGARGPSLAVAGRSRAGRSRCHDLRARRSERRLRLLPRRQAGRDAAADAPHLGDGRAFRSSTSAPTRANATSSRAA